MPRHMNGAPGPPQGSTCCYKVWFMSFVFGAIIILIHGILFPTIVEAHSPFEEVKEVHTFAKVKEMHTVELANQAPKRTSRAKPSTSASSTSSSSAARSSVGYSWKLHRLEGQARCMDGSTGGVYMRQPINADRSRWLLLFVDGVGWCHHFSTCRARGFGAPFHSSASSSKWTDRPKFASSLQRGLLSGESFFKDWNAAAFGYCDGSAFLGQRERATLVGGKPYLFHGQGNLHAYVKWLLTEQGLASAQEVVVMGVGSGALSALIHLPSLRRWLPASSALYAIAEAPMFLHVPNAKNGLEETRRMKIGMEAWNATPTLLPPCVEQYREDPWKCLFPEFFGPWLPSDVPVLVAQKKLEPSALKLYGGIDKAQEVPNDVRSAIGERVQASIQAVKPSGILTTCVDQALLTSDACFDYHVRDHGHACDMVQQWLETKGRVSMAWQEEC